MGALEDDIDHGVRACVEHGHDSWTTHADKSPCTPACPINPAYVRPAKQIFTHTSLAAANKQRQHLWNGTNPDGTPVTSGPLYAATELAGEIGEVCNVVKKLERERLGRVGSRATVEQLEEEIGDGIICLFLLGAEYGIDPMRAAARKFNKTSRALGFSIEMVEA